MKHVSRLALLLPAILLAGCATAPPKNPNNACDIFKQHPTWYWDAQNAAYHWHVNIGTQLAIIDTESAFNPDIRTQRKKLLGFIPWTHVSSAYGYTQSLDGTWRTYQYDTHSYAANRDSFADATDFIGWYSTTTRNSLNTRYLSAEDFYLAYHEGLNGYRKKSYVDQPWLVNLAEQVQVKANRYNAQLEMCRGQLPRKPWYWWG